MITLHRWIPIPASAFFISLIVLLGAASPTHLEAAISLSQNPILNPNPAAMQKAFEENQELFKDKDMQDFIELCLQEFSRGLTADIFFQDSGAALFGNLNRLFKHFFPKEPEGSWMGLLLAYLLENQPLLERIHRRMQEGYEPIPEMAGLLGLAMLLKDASCTKDKLGRIASAKLPDGTVLQFNYLSQGMVVTSRGPDGTAKYVFNNQGLMVRREINRPGQAKIITTFKYFFDNQGRIQNIVETEQQGKDRTVTVKDRYGNILEKIKNGVKVFETGVSNNAYFETSYTEEGVIASTVRYTERPLTILQWLQKNRLLGTASWKFLEAQYEAYRKKLLLADSKYDSAGRLNRTTFYAQGETLRQETYHPDGKLKCLTLYTDDQPDFALEYTQEGWLASRTEYTWDPLLEKSVADEKFIFDAYGRVTRSILFDHGRESEIVDADGTLTQLEYFSNDKNDPFFHAVAKQTVILPNGEKTVSYFSKYQGIVKQERSLVKDHVKSTLAAPEDKKSSVPLGVMLMMRREQLPQAGAAQISNERIGIAAPEKILPQAQP